MHFLKSIGLLEKLVSLKEDLFFIYIIINTPISELGKKTEICIWCACDRKKCSSCCIEKNCRGE